MGGIMKKTVNCCPCCGNDLALIELTEGITGAGTLLGRTFFKCSGGCSIGKILFDLEGLKRYRPLSADIFLDVLTHARSLGKRVSTADKERELAIKMSVLRGA